jgi:predicted permease
MILEKIASIFMIMAIGFIAKKLKAVDGPFLRDLSAFTMNIALPFAFVASLDRSIPQSVLPELGVMALWSFGIHAAEIAVAALAYRSFPENQRRVLSFATVFTNCAFMGLPIAQSVGGAMGLMFASIYNIAYVVLVYTYGTSLFQRKGESVRWRKVVFNPGVIAIGIGLVLWLLPFSLPSFLLDSIGLMAKLQTPLAMFIVGANIANIRLESISSWKILLLVVVVRLVAMPLAVYGAMATTGLRGMAPGIAMLLTAMPAGAQTVVVAEKMGGDSTFASEVVFVTTALSIFSIPLFAALVG